MYHLEVFPPLLIKSLIPFNWSLEDDTTNMFIGVSVDLHSSPHVGVTLPGSLHNRRCVLPSPFKKAAREASDARLVTFVIVEVHVVAEMRFVHIFYTHLILLARCNRFCSDSRSERWPDRFTAPSQILPSWEEFRSPTWLVCLLNLEGNCTGKYNLQETQRRSCLETAR